MLILISLETKALEECIPEFLLTDNLKEERELTRKAAEQLKVQMTIDSERSVDYHNGVRITTSGIQKGLKSLEPEERVQTIKNAQQAINNISGRIKA